MLFNKKKTYDKLKKSTKKIDQTTLYLKFQKYLKLVRANDKEQINKLFSKKEQEYFKQLLRKKKYNTEYKSLKEINKLIDKFQPYFEKSRQLNDNIKFLIKYSEKNPKKTAQLLKSVMKFPAKK